MSLKDLATQALDNFNPETDKATSSNEGLPAGTYDVYVNSAQFHVYDSGYECIAIDLVAVGGECDSQHEFINWNLDPEFVTKDGYKLYDKYPKLMEQNIKYVSKFAFVSGVQLSDDDWEDMVTLGTALKAAKGSQFILTIEKSYSKAGKEYTNYDFEAYDEPPANQEVDISDDDLPF